MPRRYNNDPRRLTAKFSTHCKFCGAYINKYDEAFYWPATKTIKCTGCGEEEYQAFLASKCDEEVYAGNGNPYYS